MTSFLTHVLPVLIATGVVAICVMVAALEVASHVDRARRTAAGHAPARHARRATPLEHTRRIGRALAARRPRIAPQPDALEVLLSRRSAERLAQVTGGAR